MFKKTTVETKLQRKISYFPSISLACSVVEPLTLQIKYIVVVWFNLNEIFLFREERVRVPLTCRESWMVQPAWLEELTFLQLPCCMRQNLVRFYFFSSCKWCFETKTNYKTNMWFDIVMIKTFPYWNLLTNFILI